MGIDSPVAPVAPRGWKAVAVPSEHGGWGLTLEPVLLGLLVTWSWAGVALGVAAFGAFLVRTPLKLAAVDARRDNWRGRSRLAVRIALAESTLIVVAVAVALTTAGAAWLVPVAIAAPLVAIEAWYDVRSRGRRLVPELCGAVGVAGASAAIVVAGDGPASLAAAVWLVLAARSVGAIPFVRAQIARGRRGVTDTRASDLAQLTSAATAAIAWRVDTAALAGAITVVAIGVVQVVGSRHDPPAVKVLGVRQMVLGLVVVASTAAGMRLA